MEGTPKGAPLSERPFANETVDIIKKTGVRIPVLKDEDPSEYLQEFLSWFGK